MSLEIVPVWVLRWSESRTATTLPETPCVYFSEKAALEARGRWITAIAAQNGIDPNGDNSYMDALRNMWQIDERFALRAELGGQLKRTRYFLLDDISGNMVYT